MNQAPDLLGAWWEASNASSPGVPAQRYLNWIGMTTLAFSFSD
jgi:hypothetical protein